MQTLLGDVLKKTPVFKELWTASKPRLSSLVLITTSVGLIMAPGRMSLWRMWGVVFFTACVVGGANILNGCLEKDVDALMLRTRNRPFPAGRLSLGQGWFWGVCLSLVSVCVLAWMANVLTALLAVCASVLYVCVYTPMKRWSWTAVLVGAVPGAVPPLMGWTAVSGVLGEGGLALFALLFFWQLPHFFAIALYLKEDYARGGIQVLPVSYGETATRWAIVLSAAVLLPVGLLPVASGIAGVAYGVGSLGLGALFLGWTVSALSWGSLQKSARGIFLGSVAYLTVLMILLVLRL
jgi:protoheme IX farnesyltransferase